MNNPKPKVSKNVIVLGLVSFFNDFASEMIYPIIPIFLTSVLGAPMAVIGLIPTAPIFVIAYMRLENREPWSLVLPQAILSETGARIMGLDDPTKKMSKSTEQPGHAIALLDGPDEIRAKIARATTDSLREIRFDENRPGVTNLLGIYQSFTGMSREDIESRFEGKGYADLKKNLADIVIGSLQPLQTRYQEATADPGYLDSVLEEGEDRVRPLAEMTLARVKERMGLG